MSKILCELRVCTNIEETNLFKTGSLEKNNIRLTQYVNGIKKFIELNKKYIDDKKMDVYVTDNTVSSNKKLHQSLLDVIPENVKIITSINNNYGCYNKGAGDIEQWLYCSNLIKEYDYFIHFEPRQLLIDNYFIDNFMKNPRALFTHNKNPNSPRHFNTGLFACKSKDLLTFIDVVSPSKLVKHNVGIEYVLYNFFRNNNLDYDVLEKMNLIWYDTYAQKEYHW